MSQDILENKSRTEAVRATIVFSHTEGVVNSEHGGILFLADGHLDGEAGMETLVKVHALVVKGAFQQTAFIDVASAEEEVFLPGVLETEDVLVLGEGVGDEVTSHGKTVGLREVEVVGGGDA